MAVTPIDWNAGGNVSLGDLYKGRQVRNDERRVDAYERMVDAQVDTMHDTAERKHMQAAAEWTTRAGNAVLSAPPQDRPRLYQMALEEGQRLGFDMSGLPPQYDRGVEDRIRFSVAQAQRIGGRQRAPAGGGGAGYTLDAPYQPAGAEPQQPVAPQPAAPMVAPRPQQTPQPQATTGGTQPMGPSVGIRAGLDSITPPTPPAAPPAGNFGPTATVAMPPAPAPQAPAVVPNVPIPTRQPAPDAPPPVAPPAAQPPMVARPPAPPMRDDAGQDAPGAAPVGPALEPGDRIVRGRTGAPRVVGGMLEVRDARGQTQFRPMNKPGAAAKPQLEDITDDNGRVVAQRDPRTGKITTIDKDAFNGGKPVDNSARDDLKKAGSPAVELRELVRDFKPNFGGHILWSGGISNMLGRTFGDDTGQAQWWQRYDATANEIRHGLFGASLTAGEKAAFDAAMVSPNMNSKEIEKNLSRQRDIMLRAASRLAKGMIDSGYRKDAVEQTLGIRLSDLPDPFGEVQTGGAPRAAAPAGDAPPVGALKEGTATTFKNGQTWTLEGGQPKRLR